MGVGDKTQTFRRNESEGSQNYESSIDDKKYVALSIEKCALWTSATMPGKQVMATKSNHTILNKSKKNGIIHSDICLLQHRKWANNKILARQLDWHDPTI
jgi:hypothetical protein